MQHYDFALDFEHGTSHSTFGFTAMSEFKFACPICGQHITADSKDTGSQIPCPTCFRKIVVPPAPSSDDPKFVLSASEANKPRPPQPTVPQLDPIQKGPEKTAVPIALIVSLVLACAAVGTLIAFRGKIFHSKPSVGVGDPSPETNTNEVPTPQPAQAEFTGKSLWTLDLSGAKIPDDPAAGSIHGRAFTYERATLTGSNLTLRVGRNGPVELGLNIYFFNRQAEELSGKTAEIKPTDTTAPRVVLRWKDADRASKTFQNGYAMRVEFGLAAGGNIPGKIFLCTPDDSKSWVAGTFRAEIRKPAPPKPKPPTQRSSSQ
jgi:DNA-directed RNA polymerase subunit RPC12/RpoP